MFQAKIVNMINVIPKIFKKNILAVPTKYSNIIFKQYK